MQLFNFHSHLYFFKIHFDRPFLEIFVATKIEIKTTNMNFGNVEMEMTVKKLYNRPS